MEPRMNFYHHLILFALVLLMHRSIATSDSFLLAHYDLKINSSEATCRLVNHPNLPEDRRTLAGRGCMCDEDCMEYKDCCKDSRYYYPAQQSQLPAHTCSETTAAYVKNKCAPEWKDQKIAQLCEQSGRQNLNNDDISAILPISNQKTRTTYLNAYCAACNYDQDMQSWVAWNMGAACGEAPPGYLKNPIVVVQPPYSAYPSNSIDNNYSSGAGGGYDTNSRINMANRFAYQIGPGFVLDINLYIYNGSVPEGYTYDTISLPVKIQTNFPANQPNAKNRLKRLSDSVNFKKYAPIADKIALTAKYDSYNQKFVSKYENRDFVCEFFALLPENSEMFTRRCVPFLVNTCPKSYKDKSVIEECSIHTQIVYSMDKKKPYRNKDCARCNGEKEEMVKGHPQDTRETLPGASLNMVANGNGSSGVNNPPNSTSYRMQQ